MFKSSRLTIRKNLCSYETVDLQRLSLSIMREENRWRARLLAKTKMLYRCSDKQDRQN